MAEIRQKIEGELNIEVKDGAIITTSVTRPAAP
jgi:molybdopterin-binding protein